MVNEAPMSDRRTALREALIVAAERIIGERGYQALRARELASEVGCALGAIYGVFPDLDALVLAVKARTLDNLDAEIARRFAVEKPRATQPNAIETAKRELQILAETYLGFASGQPRLWQALFEHRAFDAAVPEAYLAKLERVVDYVDRPLAAIAPKAPPSVRRLFAGAMLAAVHGVIALGLDQKLGAMPAASLAWQVRAIVEAAAAGVVDRPAIVSIEKAG